MKSIVVFLSPKDRQWYFHLVGRNGRILAQSEGYKRKRSAVKTAHLIKLSAYDADIVVK